MKAITIAAILATSTTIAAMEPTVKTDDFSSEKTTSCATDYNFSGKIAYFAIEKSEKKGVVQFHRLITISAEDKPHRYSSTHEKIGDTVRELKNVASDSEYGSSTWINVASTSISKDVLKRWSAAKKVTLRLSTKGGYDVTADMPDDLIKCAAKI